MSKTPAKRGDMARDLVDAIEKATSKWAKTKKSEEHHPGYVSYRRARMTVGRGTSQKEAAEQVMEEAYMLASANGTLPAMARQVMYQARPKIQELTGGKRLDDQYFCQTLLPNYIEEYGVDWDVVFDARGHFEEPHDGGKIVPLGTLEVRGYLNGIREAEFKDASFKGAKVDTLGPDGCFSAVLFIEKEGFTPLFNRVKLAERYDLAVMSTKGMSVTAARSLIDRMCGDHDLPLLVLHDFDVAGFSILDTLRRDTRRYQFENDITVIDLGLRLADVQQMALLSESAASTKSSSSTIRDRLLRCGASADEAEYLLHKRVELNAMHSAQLVAFVEDKLKHHGIKKVVPERDQLDEAYRLFTRGRVAEKVFKREMKKLNGAAGGAIPKDLADRVEKRLWQNPAERWDEAVAEIVKADAKAGGTA
jgi:Topoisomerase 6 subunit A/Spo11, Toprim domain